MLEEFGAIRADFLRYYKIRNPLKEEAKLMMLLIAKLPPDSAFGRVLERRFGERIRDAAKGDETGVPEWRRWAASVDKSIGNVGNVVSEQQLLAGMA